MLTKDELPPCPWATTIRLIGNKWKMFILRNLFLYDVCRFNELKRGIPGISTKVLTENLRSMEQDGLVVRTVYPEVPPKVEYSLSDLGKTLRPLFDAMGEWGEKYRQLVLDSDEEDSSDIEE